MQLPDSAPFSQDQKTSLSALLASLDPAQAGWLSGFLAGATQGGATAVATSAPVSLPVTLLYGTESGNAETLAAENMQALKSMGYEPKMVNMADADVGILKDINHLLVLVSTWGDGDPPDSVGPFYDALLSEAAPKLDHLSYSVCALGDTSYEKFCQCGKDFDKRLGDLGAARLVDRVDCDVDYDEAHATWFKAVVAELDKIRGAAAPATAAVIAPPAPQVEYGKKNPFPSPVKAKVLLNGKGSNKETWHIELGLEGSGMTYEVGDALGLVARNAPDVVGSILDATGFDPQAKVKIKEDDLTLGEALESRLDVTGLTSVVLNKYNALAESAALTKLLDPANKKELSEFLWGRQIIDILGTSPVQGMKPQDLVGILRKLPPRLYSIASSLKAHPNEVHLTIAAVRYQAHGRERKGVASTFVADMIGEGDQVPVFVSPNKHFKLPRSGDTPIIMIGPGTGVAPFRAFVEERSVNGDKGKSWLFFGDQHYTFDFMYQLEWQQHLKSGALTRLDVAFSRDQKEKVYVQHRMLDRAQDLWAWLEEGAHFYVCGDANRMAHDVHEALLEIIMSAGRLKRDAAEAYVEDLKKSKRYQRDVY